MMKNQEKVNRKERTKTQKKKTKTKKKGITLSYFSIVLTVTRSLKTNAFKQSILLLGS